MSVIAAGSILLASSFCPAANAESPQNNAQEAQAQSPDERAAGLVAQMTLDEKIQLVHGNYPKVMENRPEDVPVSAGWVPGIERLGIPAQRATDASLGVAAGHRTIKPATALPSSMLLAATWNPKLAFDSGALIGKEARQQGFNILLAGGVNLVREPRGGRNFEYLGEDPLLAGTLVGYSVKGIQSNNIVSTMKHYPIHPQETGRFVLSVNMDEAALRESDLLAFQKGIEIGDPGSIMCSYNRINSHYGCENAIMFDILKKDWGYPGWVISDWGAVHSTVKAVHAGLDQEAGEELDTNVWYGQMLKDAVGTGAVSEKQIDGMVTRILRSLYATGVMDNPVGPPQPLDLEKGKQVAKAAALEGIVLLKNDDNLLPLAASAKKIAVIGPHADAGVLSGAGSSQVIPEGSVRLDAPSNAPDWLAGIYYHPSSPLEAIRKLAPSAEVSYANGNDIQAAAALAAQSDVVILFGGQWTTEAMDASITLDGEQDQLIDAVAAANPKTVVVLQTGGPVLMPWLDKAGAVVEAWYSGAGGGEAIADIIFGKANPSGRLPVTFPASQSQLPNPEIPGARLPLPSPVNHSEPEPFDMSYPEGADIGYRWYAKTDATPLFPFGFGLSYTSFEHAALAFDKTSLTARFTVTNTGGTAGRDTPQLYVKPPKGERRLVGWGITSLDPGESKTVMLAIDPRFIAHYADAAKGWVVAKGKYHLILAKNATDPGIQITVKLPKRTLPVAWHPDAAATSWFAQSE
ncbi:MAG: glycoside hydrolase family 3 C-terminal domain-containing protein [Sphingobium sp.]|nr:glycoside hydrolase family 3 C-terminal domain-containing protein [Sphingobium sp.]